MPQKNKIKLSIVVPIFNEERYIEKLFLNIIKYFNEENIEIIFVNDGSFDNSKKILEKLKINYDYFFKFILINLEKNSGKGRAVKSGIDISKGEYILLQDADLELDSKDSRELYETIDKDKNIKCIFGSRYLSGKLKKHNYFINQFIGKFNTLIFNLFFGQSLTDIHCGLKIMSREVYEKIDLSINDFGLEIDIASQVIKKNFFIYEMGVSYYSRTIKEGKKITWIDGLKSYYYLFKVRFLDNPNSTKLSIITSCCYMSYVGSYFGMGLGNTLFIIIFFLLGLIIGLKTKILSSLTIFLFIYLGSLFGQGQGQVLSVLIFFILGIYFTNKLRKKINIKHKSIKILF
tara:strand:- start:985 stop:2022 length:1038 start_codon:yes stop_codon:yes gene_type:complete